MGSRTDGRSRTRRRGLASFVSFLLLFAFALGQSSSLTAFADSARSHGGGNGTDTEGVVTDSVTNDEVTDGTATAEEAPAEEAPAEEAPAEEAPAEEVSAEAGTGDGAASDATTSKKDKVDEGPGVLSHGGLHGGDVNLDFVAAGPFTYDHSTGVGGRPQFGYDNRNISKTNGVVESLEGGDFACGDLVTFFVQVQVEDGSLFKDQSAVL